MANLRDQFKATDTNVLKKKIKEEDQIFGKISERTDFLEIADGVNKFRIFPKHPGAETFYEPKTVHWISIEGEDGTPKRRTVSNSRIHGGTKLDIIEEYIRMAKDHLGKSDDEEASDKLAKITDWKGGLLPSTTWVCYANKHTKKDGKTEKEFGLLELKRSVRDGMNKLSVIEDEDEAIVVDPFTDPDTGKLLLITYNPKAKKSSDYYSVTLGQNEIALTDEELEAFSKVKPLHELYRNSYGKKDFDLACQGIAFFDEQNEIGLFDTDEWQEVLDKVKKQYSDSAVSDKPVKSDKSKKASKPVVDEDDEDEEEEKPKTKKSPFKESVEESDEDGDDSTEAIDLDELDRNGLKALIKEQELGIVVKSSMSDDTLRDEIRKVMEQSSEEIEVEEVEEDEDEEVATKPVVKEVAKNKAPTLAEIKAKLAEKAKKG